MDIECTSGCEEGTMKREQTSFLKAFARFVYGKAYGAFVACIVVASALHALQVVNSLIGDLVPWPKEGKQVYRAEQVLSPGQPSCAPRALPRSGVARTDPNNPMSPMQEYRLA